MRFGQSAYGLLIGMLLLEPVVSHGAPAINSTTGAVADGTSIVISGSGFGQKSPAKPYLWAPMDGSSSPSALGVVSSWNSTGQMSYASGCGAGGGGCMAGATSDGRSTNDWAASIVSPASADWNAYGQRTYVYRKSKKTFDYDNSKNVKSIRFWGRSSSGGIQEPSFYFGISMGRVGIEGIPAVYADYSMAASTLVTAKGPVGQWYSEEMSIKSNSSSSAADADYRLAVNGGPYLVQFPNTTWMLNQFKIKTDSGYANDGRMQIVFPVHMLVEGSDGWIPSPAGSQFWADDVYVDTTWARVMIGDNAVFTSCTAREIQIPTAWTDQSISINLNLKAFPAGKPKYLFVVDQNGDASPGRLLDANAIRPKAPAIAVQ
ncbi:MAG: hypothetical protein ABI769_08335 [Pseudomonadota bacterium]